MVIEKIKYSTLLLILFSSILFGCSTSLRSIDTKEPSFRAVETLNQPHLIPVSQNYKRNYPKIAPYLFDNSNKVFLNQVGDFFNIRHTQGSAYNFMVGYFREYGRYNNVLIVRVRTASNSASPITNFDLSVHSSSFGGLKSVNTHKSDSESRYPSLLFIKEIRSQPPKTMQQIVKNDTITVSFQGKNYRFINPEI